MNDAPVLNVGPRSNADGLDVGAQRGVEPHTGVLREMDVSDQDGARGDKGGGVDFRRGVEVVLESFRVNHGCKPG